jgi:hypothetical protein
MLAATLFATGTEFFVQSKQVSAQRVSPSILQKPQVNLRSPYAKDAFSVKAIRAFLFLHSESKWHDTDLIANSQGLYNTMIGEGIAGSPSDTMIIYVDLEGPSFANAKGKIEILVKAGKRKIAMQAFSIGDFFNEGTGVTVPMLVHGLPGEPVTVTATLKGVSNVGVSRLVKSIEFGGGE